MKNGDLPSSDQQPLEEFAEQPLEEFIDQLGIGFDFEGFFSRFSDDTASKSDYAQFTVRALQWFTLLLWQEKPIPPWLSNYFTEAFTKVLLGGDWRDEIPLPWLPQEDCLSPAERKALNHYCDVSKAIAAAVAAGERAHGAVTPAMRKVAADSGSSYESVSANYYRLRRLFPKKQP